MLQLVIFDADGVLFDSTHANTAYYNEIFARADEPPMSPVEEKAGVFMSAPQVFELRAGRDEARIARMREVAQTLDPTPFFHLMRPFPDLQQFLIGIKRHYRIGLATNRSVTVPALLEFLGLQDVFDAIASMYDGVKPKPAPDIIQLCLQRARIAAQQAVYVGDSETDRIAAESAGIHFIGIGSRVDHQHSIPSLAELPSILQRLFSE
jgi:phosphoglycolate phosphatase